MRGMRAGFAAIGGLVLLTGCGDPLVTLECQPEGQALVSSEFEQPEYSASTDPVTPYRYQYQGDQFYEILSNDNAIDYCRFASRCEYEVAEKISAQKRSDVVGEELSIDLKDGSFLQKIDLGGDGEGLLTLVRGKCVEIANPVQSPE